MQYSHVLTDYKYHPDGHTIFTFLVLGAEGVNSSQNKFWIKRKRAHTGQRGLLVCMLCLQLSLRCATQGFLGSSNYFFLKRKLVSGQHTNQQNAITLSEFCRIVTCERKCIKWSFKDAGEAFSSGSWGGKCKLAISKRRSKNKVGAFSPTAAATSHPGSPFLFYFFPLVIDFSRTKRARSNTRYGIYNKVVVN